MADKQQVKPGDVQPPAPTPPDPDFTPVATVPDEQPPPQPVKKLPHRTEDGKLTRAGMEHHLKAGGSVMHGGRIITDVAELPQDADLAKGDTEREKQVAQALDEQIATLAAQRAKLGQPKVEAKPVAAAADDLQAKAQQAEESKREATQQQQAGKGGKK